MKGPILPDISLSFGGIGRNTLRRVLYKQCLPIPWIKTPIDGHNNAQLCGTHKGITSEYVHDNIVVFQGSPISGQLFIIYTEILRTNVITQLTAVIPPPIEHTTSEMHIRDIGGLMANYPVGNLLNTPTFTIGILRLPHFRKLLDIHCSRTTHARIYLN